MLARVLYPHCTPAKNQSSHTLDVGVQYSPVRVYCTPAKNRSPHTLDVGYDIHQLGYCIYPCQKSISTHIGCGVQYSPVRYCTPAKNTNFTVRILPSIYIIEIVYTVDSRSQRILQTPAMWLDDEILAATQHLLSLQYPAVGGL